MRSRALSLVLPKSRVASHKKSGSTLATLAAVGLRREGQMQGAMKDKIRAITVLAFGFAALAFGPARGYAQDNPTAHHHYIVVDMGSLGGPDSIVFEVGTRALNNNRCNTPIPIKAA